MNNIEAEQNYLPQPEENMINQLWAKYFPYWPVFLLLVALALGGAWFYLKFKLPLYESTATLLIKDEKRGTEDSKVTESLNPLSNKKIIENEIDVIKSRALMNQVVDELKLYAPVYAEAKWKDVSAYDTSPIKVEVQSPDSLVETKRIDFVYDVTTRKIKLNGKTFALNQWINTSWGKLRFLSSNKNYSGQSPLYFSLVNPKRVVKSLSEELAISSSGKLSSVVNLKFRDEVPKRSEDILNTLIAVYDRASVNDKNALAANTLSFLDERLKNIENDLENIEKRMQQYRASKGAIDLSSQSKLFLENVSANDQKLSDVNMKLSVLNQVEQNLLSKDVRGGIAPSTLGIDDPVLTNLLNKLYDAKSQYEKLRRTTGENNPELTSLADQIDRLSPSILDNIRSQQRSLRASKRNLYSTNTSYNSTLSGLPQQERDLVEITREQAIKSSIYSFLLQKKEEAALSHSATVSDTRVIDKAESSLDPVGQSNKIVFIIAVLLALGLGVLLISARESLSGNILFRQEIEFLSSFPVIGEIVLEKSKTPLVLQKRKTSFIAEEFRLLRTSLNYLGIGSRSKKILITSTISGEGKSFVAVNLALSLAMAGKKVVLVEFDLSNPTLAFKLGINSGKGVADYLMGEVEADETIIAATNNPNLFLIPAGTLPDDPSELILHHRTTGLLNDLESQFDYVLVDSAPVGLLSDGYVLSRYCDATLFVVRHKYTPKKMLQRLEQNNKINELKNIAIVFNGVDSRGFGNSKYGYGYGYSYGNKNREGNKVKLGKL